MLRTTAALVVSMALFGFLGNADGAITIGGGLSDWGITPGSGGLLGQVAGGPYYSNYYYYPDSPLTPPRLLPDPPEHKTRQTDYDGRHIYYQMEDTPNGVDRVGPNYGGQDYDAEFLAVHIDPISNILYLAIATGQRQDNSSGHYGPGDIRFVTSEDKTFGIEVGGGTSIGGGASSGEIMEGATGVYFKLNSNGYTTDSWVATPGTHKAGSVWFDPSWWVESVGGNPQSKTQIAQMGTNGTFRGNADYSYLWGVGGDSAHAFIELSVPISMLTSQGELRKVTWAPSCGNDLLEVDLPSGKGRVPEPASALAWSLLAGLAGALAWCRRRSKAV